MLLSSNPNTQTIIEAFIRAVAPSVHNPFYGLPTWVYVDNGKDYRSKLFETGQVKEQDLGYLNSNIATNSVLQLFNIRVTHALPYQGWSKPVERWFGTLEEIWIREVPGWCGGSPLERPEDFSKRLREQLEGGKLWTMDQLHEYLRDVVLPAYLDRPHDGYEGKTPGELYRSLPRARNDQPGWEMLNVLRDKKVTRQIGQQGVKLKNIHYWADEMIGLAGKEASVFYSEGDMSTVGVVLDGHFLAEAAPLEAMRMVGEDPEVVAAHMEKQNRQLRDTKERIRRAGRAVFADEVDLKRSRGNITAIEYEKAARARTQRRKELEEVKANIESAGDDKMRAVLLERYDKLKQEAQ
jgi:putative transposase